MFFRLRRHTAPTLTSRPPSGGFPIRFTIPDDVNVRGVSNFSVERSFHTRDLPNHDPRSDDYEWVREPWGGPTIRVNEKE